MFLRKIQSWETWKKTRAGQSGIAGHLKTLTLNTQPQSYPEPPQMPLGVKPHLLRIKIANTGIARFIALHFIRLCSYWVLGGFFVCFFPPNNLKVCGNPALSMSESESDSCWVVSDSMQPYRLQPTRLLCSRNSPGKNTRAHYHSFLQGIFPTQRSNPGSPALQVDSLPSEPPGKPLEQVYQYHFPICEFIYPLEQPHKEVISCCTSDISAVHLREGMWLLQGQCHIQLSVVKFEPAALDYRAATHHPSLDSSFWVEDGQVQKTMK